MSHERRSERVGDRLEQHPLRRFGGLDAPRVVVLRRVDVARHGPRHEVALALREEVRDIGIVTKPVRVLTRNDERHPVVNRVHRHRRLFQSARRRGVDALRPEGGRPGEVELEVSRVQATGEAADVGAHDAGARWVAEEGGIGPWQGSPRFGLSTA